MSDQEERKELQNELSEEAREEEEDLAEKNTDSDAGEGEKILETVTLPTDEINAELEREEAGKDSGEEENSIGEGNEDKGQEKEEKILETVTLPTDAVNAELARQEETKEEETGNCGKKPKRHNPFAAIGRLFRRAKVWQRILAIVVIVVLVAGLAGYGYFHSKYSLMDYNTGEFHSDESLAAASEESTQDELENAELEKRQEEEAIPEQSVIESTQEVEKATGVVNILLIGTDDRTKKFSNNARGDTCILLSINRDQDRAHLVSFERATGVKVLSGEYEGQWDWLTHMFWYGGPAMMTEEIRDNFKVDVTKYIRVNIYTFMELLDSIGGVDIELTKAEADNINHPGTTYTAGNERRAIALGYTVQTDLVEGMNHLDPGTAMCYARLRAIDDDWHRVVRQRKVILAAIDKMKNMSLAELDNLLNNVLPLVQTNLTEADVASLLPDALNFVNMEYDSITFPLRHTYGLMDGMQGRKVLAVDFDTNSLELQNLLYGDATTEELTAKYENTPSDYNYKDSETYQQNYQDAETAVGRSGNTARDTGVASTSGYVGNTTVIPGTTAADSSAVSADGAGAVGGTTAAGQGTAGSTGAGVSQSAGADADTGTDAAAGVPDPVSSTIAGGAGTAAGSTAAASGTASTSAGIAASNAGTGNTTSGATSTQQAAASGTTAGNTATPSNSSLGKVVSTSTDPATGVVTTVYYNEETGVRTSVASHPASGATTVSTTNTQTGDTETVHTDINGTVTTHSKEEVNQSSAAGTSAVSVTGQTAGTGQ